MKCKICRFLIGFKINFLSRILPDCSKVWIQGRPGPDFGPNSLQILLADDLEGKMFTKRIGAILLSIITDPLF